MVNKNELVELMNDNSEKMEIIEAEIVSTSTGLSIQNHHFGKNGFTYASGVRNFGKLKIVEEVVKGTAVTFLSSVQVYDENAVLIIDYSVEKNTYYSREIVRKIVLKEMLNMLKKASIEHNKSFNKKEAKKHIDSLLDNAYYKESYQAVVNWAKDIGIEFF